MKKSIKIATLLGVITVVTSCSKSPEDYANEYCECGKKHMEAGDGAFAHKDCEAIIDEAKEKYDGNEEAEKAFKEVAKECMTEVLGG